MINIDEKFLKNMPFAEGGEAMIYSYDKDKLIKIYKPHINLKTKHDKITTLMSKNLPPNVIKPLDIVNHNGKFVGYQMLKINGEEVKRLSNKKFVKTNKISHKDILKILVDIKNVLSQLHVQNIVLSDFNDCNILFNNNFDVFFIDCDSWSIDNYKCDVAMESFKDPYLIGNNFSNKTDYYSYAVLLFKSLTKISPFGGTTNPDINILERMKKGISVIGNNQVTIPKTIANWNFIPPNLLKELKDIFETSKRFLVNDSIDDFYNNLKFCNKDNEFYYSKFSECPFCNALAKILEKPKKIIQNATTMLPVLYLSGDDIEFILSLDLYIDKGNFIVHNQTKKRIRREKNHKYYFSNNGDICYTVTDDMIIINAYGKEYIFDKINRTTVDILDNKCYYIDKANNLIELSILISGNYSKKIEKCSFNNIFSINGETEYLICNMYDNMKIINISGYNYVLQHNAKIVNYGIHFDEATKRWLLVLENTNGIFNTFVFDKNNLVYESDNIKYSSNLSNICFNSNIIFTPCDGVIKGFSFSKNAYKDFDCNVVTEDSILKKIKNKFFIINEKEIYTFG